MKERLAPRVQERGEDGMVTFADLLNFTIMIATVTSAVLVAAGLVITIRKNIKK